MAKPIPYQPEPPKLGPDAHEELETLLQTMHQHGVLRLANDLISANSQIASTIMQGLNTPGALNAVQNLAAMLMALGRIPPTDFYKVVMALKDGFECLARPVPAAEAVDPRGILGAYKLLKDDDLWRGLAPMVKMVKEIVKGLNRKVEGPAADFYGKSTNAYGDPESR